MSWGWQQVTPYMIDFTQSVESKEDEWSRFNEEDVNQVNCAPRTVVMFVLNQPGTWLGFIFQMI